MCHFVPALRSSVQSGTRAWAWLATASRCVPSTCRSLSQSGPRKRRPGSTTFRFSRLQVSFWKTKLLSLLRIKNNLVIEAQKKPNPLNIKQFFFLNQEVFRFCITTQFGDNFFAKPWVSFLILSTENYFNFGYFWKTLKIRL